MTYQRHFRISQDLFRIIWRLIDHFVIKIWYSFDVILLFGKRLIFRHQNNDEFCVKLWVTLRDVSLLDIVQRALIAESNERCIGFESQLRRRSGSIHESNYVKTRSPALCVRAIKPVARLYERKDRWFRIYTGDFNVLQTLKEGTRRQRPDV